jgi:ribonuclease VapC
VIIDTSALIAILRDEPEAADYATAIEAAPRRHISAANFLETAIVIDGSRDPVASRRFDDLVREAQLVVEPGTEVRARVARDVYRDFGRGSGHPARLNFGDCFAYALARSMREPLLFKGDGFAHTDITPNAFANRINSPRSLRRAASSDARLRPDFDRAGNDLAFSASRDASGLALRPCRHDLTSVLPPSEGSSWQSLKHSPQPFRPKGRSYCLRLFGSDGIGSRAPACWSRTLPTEYC